MNYEVLETSKDGTARLLKATKDGSEYLYIEKTVNNATDLIQISDSRRVYGKDRFPEPDIESLRKNFQEAGFPISDKWQGEWNLGALEQIWKDKR